MKYQDFVIEAANSRVAKDPATKQWRRELDVRVLRSQASGDSPSKWITTGCDELPFKRKLDALEDRTLDRDGLFELGKILSLLLMPSSDGVSGVRELFARSVDLAGADAGVRLRLMLPPQLASLPWEYLYLDRTGGNENTMNGFIGLDPRIGIVRHEALTILASSAPITGDISVLAALASPADMDPLDLKKEEAVLRKAFAKRGGLALDVFQDATLADLGPRIVGSQIFHFAGHGAFRQQAGSQPGDAAGVGMLAFEDSQVEAEQLGVNLRGQGIRLAVLGGCETGRRVGPYTAGSVAVGLVRSEIPAVVANQYAILDSSAIAFCRGFYTALDGGLPLERAMNSGRLEVFNSDKNGRDWGVPVLYLRAQDGELFAGAADATKRADARRSAEANVVVRAKEVAAGGFLTGAKLEEMLYGKLGVEVAVAGTVFGTVHGARIERMTSGTADVSLNVDTVGNGGEAVGLEIGEYGLASVAVPFKATDGSTRGPESRPGRAAAKPPSAAPPPPSPAATSTVNVERIDGGSAIGTQYNYTTFTQVAATERDPDTGLIKEDLRLDVGSPTHALVEEAFDLLVQIKQPGSPPLSVAAAEQVTSADGSIFRRKESEIVHYKIVPGGDGFSFDPPAIRLQLLPSNESKPVSFEVISHKAGKRKLRINAFQVDDTLAAQTFLTLDVAIATE